jgi:hypothetical protein
MQKYVFILCQSQAVTKAVSSLQWIQQLFIVLGQVVKKVVKVNY